MTNPIAAINAYQQIANMPTTQSSASSLDDFSSILTNTLGNQANKVKQSEQVALQTLTGDASIEELTLAISQAQSALRTITAVRDRVISAYQDIIKMPI